MISKIDITIFFLERISGEILDVINGRKPTDDLTDLVKGCINGNKGIVGLERYSISIHSGISPSQFSVEFFFKDLHDSLTVVFFQADNIGSYNARLANKHIIVSLPSSLFSKDLMYCSPYNKILYVDYFTTWVPIDDDDRRLSVDELQDKKRLDFEQEKKEFFLSFYNRITGKEKEYLLVANVDLQQDDDAKSENCKFLLDLIRDEFVSAVVTSDDETYTVLRNLLPVGIAIYKYDERICPLAKRQWFSKAVRQINQELETFDMYYGNEDRYYLDRYCKNHEKWKNNKPCTALFNEWVVNLVKYYQIPYSMVYDICYSDDSYSKHYDIQALLDIIRGVERIYHG
mgnify:CR=1 FL=1